MNFPKLQKSTRKQPSEWTAINDLKNDKNIEIKEADKAGSFVILSKSHYKSMLLSQLNDEFLYILGIHYLIGSGFSFSVVL